MFMSCPIPNKNKQIGVKNNNVLRGEKTSLNDIYLSFYSQINDHVNSVQHQLIVILTYCFLQQRCPMRERVTILRIKMFQKHYYYYFLLLFVNYDYYYNDIYHEI